MTMPERDFGQEIEKTRGCAHALEAALKAVIGNKAIVSDAEDPQLRGIASLAEVLADRLDDLCLVHDQAEANRLQVARLATLAAGHQPPTH